MRCLSYRYAGRSRRTQRCGRLRRLWPPAQVLASVPQQLEGVGGGLCGAAPSGSAPVFLDEVGLHGCGDFVGGLQHVVAVPIARSVVNH